MKHTSNSLIPTLVVALVANLLIFYFIFSQITGVSSISSEWQDVEDRNVEIAINLTELERGFGYVGFIHHFKNYVIRRSDTYYTQALKSYDEVAASLQAFKKHPSLSENDWHAIQVIEATLNEYAQKLMQSKSFADEMPVNELDEIVKVDDSFAESALIQLRGDILPRLQAEKDRMNRKVKKFREKTLIIGLCLIPLFLFSTFMTIRTLRRQASNVNELTAIFNATPNGIIYIDMEGFICKANDATADIFGYTNKELLQLKVEDLIERPLRKKHVHMRQDFMTEEQMRNMGTRDAKVTGLRKDGVVIELSVAIASRKLNGKMYGICVIKDMTKINTLKQNSDSDHLTALSNRRHFDCTLRKELNRCERNGREASLLMIDLDHFKELNDSYGHLEGDKALKAVAEFLKKSSRESDYIARWGGDEFVIFCPDVAANEAYNFADRLRVAFAQHEQFSKWSLTLSIGIAGTHQVSPLTPEQFLNAADTAVYSAKNAGKNTVIHFKP